jgi:hypothetical protein
MEYVQERLERARSDMPEDARPIERLDAPQGEKKKPPQR